MCCYIYRFDIYLELSSLPMMFIIDPADRAIGVISSSESDSISIIYAVQTCVSLVKR